MNNIEDQNRRIDESIEKMSIIVDKLTAISTKENSEIISRIKNLTNVLRVYKNQPSAYKNESQKSNIAIKTAFLKYNVGTTHIGEHGMTSVNFVNNLISSIDLLFEYLESNSAKTLISKINDIVPGPCIDDLVDSIIRSIAESPRDEAAFFSELSQIANDFIDESNGSGRKFDDMYSIIYYMFEEKEPLIQKAVDNLAPHKYRNFMIFQFERIFKEELQNVTVFDIESLLKTSGGGSSRLRKTYRHKNKSKKFRKAKKSRKIRKTHV